MTKDNGGPAFPLAEKRDVGKGLNRDWKYFDGMSLRDYMAAKALQGFLSGGETAYRISNKYDINGEQALAEHSYRIADAMIRARGEG